MEQVTPEADLHKEKIRMITLSWNKEDHDEIAKAERIFREYTRKGWLAFAVTMDNKKKQVFSFNPEAERILLIPIVEGG